MCTNKEAVKRDFNVLIMTAWPHQGFNKIEQKKIECVWGHDNLSLFPYYTIVSISHYHSLPVSYAPYLFHSLIPI